MITEEVTREIYKKYAKKDKDIDVERHVDMLRQFHDITISEHEIILNNLEEFNPFRRFLKRSLYAILEFDHNVAFVFGTHILFLSKESPEIRVHLKPEKPKSLLKKILGRIFNQYNSTRL